MFHLKNIDVTLGGDVFMYTYLDSSTTQTISKFATKAESWRLHIRR